MIVSFRVDPCVSTAWLFHAKIMTRDRAYTTSGMQYHYILINFAHVHVMVPHYPIYNHEMHLREKVQETDPTRRRAARRKRVALKSASMRAGESSAEKRTEQYR